MTRKISVKLKIGGLYPKDLEAIAGVLTCIPI